MLSHQLMLPLHSESVFVIVRGILVGSGEPSLFKHLALLQFAHSLEYREETCCSR